ncbi:MAG: DNA starvation/stationary phase protection protein, partial [Gemmatimonadaceae bacterium]|nr:DNA starvation/stationary phase protection protein [Acetobacteraceae bacterium]
NVSGTLWYALHVVLQEHYEAVGKLADRVAERLLTVGASADGRATTILQTSAIPEMPGGFQDNAQVIVWWVNAYKLVGDSARQAIRDMEEPDPTTSNLLLEVDDMIGKFQCQVRAFVQATPTDPNLGRDLNNGQPVDLPSQTPAGQPPAR